MPAALLGKRSGFSPFGKHSAARLSQSVCVYMGMGVCTRVTAREVGRVSQSHVMKTCTSSRNVNFP